MTTFHPTEQQRHLVELPDGSHLVQAPPGTGKTQVLTHRILRLLSSEPGGTFRILALTFTIKAAENLRKRVRESVGEASSRVNACTFHSFCMDALQHYGDFVGFPGDTTVYETDDERLSVLSRALREEGLAVPEGRELKALLDRIGVAKRALTPADAVTDPQLSAAYAAYVGTLRRFHACDFDDLLWLTWRLMTEAPRVARHYRRMYRHIMIDEAQDTSRAQYEILRAICGDEHRSVMMVADSDQFIYKFAGASDRWLAAFVTDFGATKHELVENFRSAEAIIDVANKLVASQRGGPAAASTLPKSLMTAAKSAPGAVQARSFATERDEAVAVATWATDLIDTGLDPATLHTAESPEVKAEDICVLCRTRYSLDHVLAEFGRRDIPFLFSTGRRLVETAEGLLVFQGLKVLRNPADRVTRESILAAWGLAASEGTENAAVVDLAPSEFFGRVASTTTEAAPFARIFASVTTTSEVGVLMQALLAAMDAAALAAQSQDENRAVALSGDARAIEERWKQYKGHTSPDGRSIGGFLGEVALAGKSVIEGPGVRVLTVHVAKGLEFKAVALIGMNEGTLPDYRNVSRKDDLADERRIAYVAVSRASRLLLLTRPRERVMPWGDTKSQQESRFVREMGLVMEHR